MRERIAQAFERITPEIELAMDLIEGICLSRCVGSTTLSMYVRGEATVKSRQRKVERMYQNGLQEEEALLKATKKILGERKFDISIDRSNWKYGKQHVNALAAFASDGSRRAFRDNDVRKQVRQ